MTGATPVRVRCDRCGPLLIPLEDLRVLARARGAEYAFTCPDCGARARRPADADLLAVLREAGVPALTLHSAPDPEGRAGGPGPDTR